MTFVMAYWLKDKYYHIYRRGQKAQVSGMKVNLAGDKTARGDQWIKCQTTS